MTQAAGRGLLLVRVGHRAQQSHGRLMLATGRGRLGGA
jgi:hypothetical protein